jgi:exopolysaccharide biosynthesis protein
MNRLSVFLAGLLLLSMACSLQTATSSINQSSDSEGSVDYGAGWTLVSAGAEYRTFRLQPSEGITFDMHVVRLDPTQVQFRTHYRPGDPLTSSRWRTELDDPLVFVNANFFTDNNQAIGLVVTDGVPFSASLVGFGGMFQVDTAGNAWVRSLVYEPYQGESFYQVVQSFPMMIEPGGIAASTGEGFDVEARRTVIAQDRSGKILMMTTGTIGQINFYDLQYWLLNSGLDLDVAFALDGGKSTAMFVSNGGDSVHIPAFIPLPTILAVYER